MTIPLENLVQKGGKRLKATPQENAKILPFISIITAVCNGCSTFEETIISVINQEYSNFEYIVIDGGSTDGTIDILKKYNDAIDFWVSERDSGIYDALNKGIKLARGEWIYFIGSDDKLVDTKVLQSVFKEQYDSRLLYGDVVFRTTGKIYGGEFNKVRLLTENICQQGIFYHSDLFKEIGCFDVKFKLLADWVFNMAVFSSISSNPYYINHIIAEYSLDGLSSQCVDSIFEKKRLGMIYRCFGLPYFLLAKIIHLKAQAVANYKKYVLTTVSYNK